MLQFAAGHGGATATATSKDIIVMAPDLLSEAPETAIQKFKPDAVHALLHAGLTPDMSKVRLYDMVLACEDTDKDDDVERRYLQTIDPVFAADTHQRRPHPSETAIRAAIVEGNDLGLKKFRAWE